jgi:hypothetical protein
MDKFSVLTILADAEHAELFEQESILVGSIRRAIERETHEAIRDLAVEMIENAIYLTGNCSSFYSKQRAQETGMRLAEGYRLFNEIEVAPGLPR